MLLLLLFTLCLSNNRDELISNSKTWIGVPYEYGGKSKEGVDCSNYVHLVYSTSGLHYPYASTRTWREGGALNFTEISLSQLKKGDVIIFDSTSGLLEDSGHAGIALSEYEDFIGAQTSTGVAESKYCDMDFDEECTKYWGEDRKAFGYFRHDFMDYNDNTSGQRKTSISHITLLGVVIGIFIFIRFV